MKKADKMFVFWSHSVSGLGRWQ